MKCIIFAFLLVLPSSYCYKKLIVPRVNESCKKIQCPRDDAPVCAKIISKTKTTYIIMVNACELEYMKCHRGLEASVVDMTYCGHENFLNLNKLIKKRDHTRVKRHSFAEIVRLEHKEPKTVLVGKPEDIVVKPEDEALEEVVPNEVVSEEAQENLAEIIPLQPDGKKPIASELEYDPPDVPEAPMPHEVVPDVHDRPRIEPDKKQDKAKLNRDPHEYDQFQDDCPTACPSRDVMVCAKCQHGIYKTFMSVCHMRMFSCWFDDEKLELVSRYPCVMSAPYLSSKPDTNPKTRIRLEDDEDKVLKFIYCMENNPLYVAGRNKLIYSENSHVYPKCDMNKPAERNLRRKHVKRKSKSYSTY